MNNSLFFNYDNRYSLAVMKKAHGHVFNRTLHPSSIGVFGENQKDAFVSVNPVNFGKDSKHKTSRYKSNLRSLKYLYIDIDVTSHSAETVWNEILDDEILGSTVPYPTHVMFSGTGLWLFWAIDEHPKALPRWIRMQKRIYEVFKDYGADEHVVTDPVRLCRIPGSINSKSGRRVELNTLSQNVYSLYEIEQEYFDYKDSPRRKYASKKYNCMPIYGRRANDIRHILLNFRNEEGYRETCLFLFRYFLVLGGMDPENALNETLSLNQELNIPLSDKEVINATKSAERAIISTGKGKYHYSNNKIIALLGLSIPEQMQLRSILSPEEANRRRVLRKRKEYVSRLNRIGKTTKDVEIDNRLIKISKLLKEGKSPKEIQTILGISKSTFYRYKSKLNNVSDAKICEETPILEAPNESPKISPSKLNVRSTYHLWSKVPERIHFSIPKIPPVSKSFLTKISYGVVSTAEVCLTLGSGVLIPTEPNSS